MLCFGCWSLAWDTGVPIGCDHISEAAAKFSMQWKAHCLFSICRDVKGTAHTEATFKTQRIHMTIPNMSETHTQNFAEPQ